jgi:hypothetical protein
VKQQVCDDDRYAVLSPLVREEVFKKFCDRLLEEEARERMRLAEIKKQREE